MAPKITTLGEKLFWSYANLAKAHSAVAKGAESYGRTPYMIRAKLFKGLCDGTMNVGSLIEEDRLKMSLPKACAYCGETERLTLDHLMPKTLGGPETGDNIVWACRGCNSGKQGKDLLRWYEAKRGVPAPPSPSPLSQTEHRLGHERVVA